MPEPGASAITSAPRVRVCASEDLAERGDAVRFDVDHLGEPRTGFVLRIDGEVRAYLNSCRHVPVELDWMPGRFLDESGQWIICAVHGAVYDPTTGLCVGGPCAGRSLRSLTVREEGQQVYWYPSQDFLAPAWPDAP